MADVGGVIIPYAMACEDVRREDNGKLIMIGVFGGSVLLNMPADLTLRFVHRIEPVGPGRYEYEIRVRVGDKPDPVGQLQAITDTVDGSVELTATPALVMHLVEPVDIHFEVRAIGAEWQSLLVLPVKPFPASPTATA